jgi:hypothetical protein
VTIAYTMQMLWAEPRPPGEVDHAFSSKTQAGALRQARRLWELRPSDGRALGYRLIQDATGDLVYEYRPAG